MEWIKRKSVWLVWVPIVCLMIGGAIAYFYISNKSPRGTIADTAIGGIPTHPATVFKLLSTNDPSCEVFEKKDFTYFQTSPMSGTDGNPFLMLMKPQQFIPGVTFPNYGFFSNDSSNQWITSLHGDPTKITPNLYTYEFEDMSPGSDYRKTIKLHDYIQLAKLCGWTFTRSTLH